MIAEVDEVLGAVLAQALGEQLALFESQPLSRGQVVDLEEAENDRRERKWWGGLRGLNP